jgi:lysophospholipase L1-like esterase
MVDDRMGLMEKYTTDGVHANKDGYRLMSALAEKAIQETLRKANIN